MFLFCFNNASVYKESVFSFPSAQSRRWDFIDFFLLSYYFAYFWSIVFLYIVHRVKMKRSNVCLYILTVVFFFLILIWTFFVTMCQRNRCTANSSPSTNIRPDLTRGEKKSRLIAEAEALLDRIGSSMFLSRLAAADAFTFAANRRLCEMLQMNQKLQYSRPLLRKKRRSQPIEWVSE